MLLIPANQHPSRKLMLLLGIFLFFIGIASLAQVLILFPFSKMKSLSDIAALNDFTNPNILIGMKLAQAAAAIISFIIPALLFAALTSEKKLGYLKINHPFTLNQGAAVLLLVFFAMPLINWMGEINSHLSLPAFLSGMEEWMKTSEESLKKITDAFLKMDGLDDLLGNILIIAVLAAVGEELLFRGAMQNVILEWTKNTHAAVWITAILFSALHMQFFGFLPRMMLGVVLGYLYVWSGTLWLPILFHFLNNGLAVLFTYLTAKGVISDAAETIGTGDSSIILVLLSLVLSTGILFYIFINSKPENPESLI